VFYPQQKEEQMSATKLDGEWMETAWAEHAFPGTETLVRHIARPRPQLRCPECRAIVYSRRHRLCGVCGEELPINYLFSAQESVQVEELLEAERQRHRAWMNRDR
jgi:predicted nucleic acid-binding Zn ribbon protein